ncbi:hypothetical protein P3X46_033158 [Hevea brasiliensis]|uniref:Disease resistance RPP13-like protein 1 n=1 Tax=Hevea brasiliensis TaxID=3981 RepID=A0ABQ9KH47_HEVBR|nr:putative disease resistance protein At3g14460 [Hevea brasiliensis]XP_021639734.1 putative disease resistance protein At3g14460 [Hevea brasiliensis]KAJ9136044.1 hypothetical protein P3X46_033158 [Hevea brasiliensis]
MDAVLLGGSVLSAFFNVLFDRMTSREVLDFFRGQQVNDELLQTLTTTMIAANGLLDDAENMQITKPAVKRWLSELKNAVYEADDFLDEIAYEALRSKMEDDSQTIIDQVRDFSSSFSYSHNPCNKGILQANLEGILKRMEDLVNLKDHLGLRAREGTGLKLSSPRLPTTSVVGKSGFYGRDVDKEAIVKLLLSDDPNGSDIGVIPIVGMGGIGKTTLAQYIYNDRRVKKWFHCKAWVCVSEEFDVVKITRGIYRKFFSEAFDKDADFDDIQVQLEEKLDGKKYLLVLDDVWSDNHEKWDILQRPLKVGAQGSKMVVTARNESVALAVSTYPTYHLKKLNDEDCLHLLAQYALNADNFGTYPDLEAIGGEIARKCGGLPLAAKTVGGVLRSKRNAEEWEEVLNSSAWLQSQDGVLPALRLSYHYLPSHLKPCFAYTAIFPQDYEFDMEKLITLWMAEGFLDKFQKHNMREEGRKWFQDLVLWSFFQLSSDNPSLFIMHDLINELAKLVSEQICFRWEYGSDLSDINIRTRHLSFSHDIFGKQLGIETVACDPQRFDASYEAKHLRTLICVGGEIPYGGISVDNDVAHSLLSAFNRLRVLSLSWCTRLVELPKTIGLLKHLRYLDLSGTPFRRLPDTISSLYNLQTLILNKCRHLIELPTDIGKLVNLCDLEISDTEKLKEMPLHVGRLTKLQNLSDYVLGERSGSSIKELEKLHCLRKQGIRNLQNVKDPQDALKANLKGKTQLRYLVLEWNGDTNDSSNERAVLEQLQPHTSVEYLLITGYGGTRFPDWVGVSSFSNIETLGLRGCKYCCSLPPVGQLRFLRVLSIEAFEELVSVGPEFYGNCTSKEKPFRSLEVLIFKDMPRWQEWVPYVDNDDGVAFPLLQQLEIVYCPNLTQALPIHLPSLTELIILGCDKLLVSFPIAPAIRDIKLRKMGENSGSKLREESGLQSFCVVGLNFPNPLQEGILRMSNLFTPLGKIMIKCCDSLMFFPLELFPKLKYLKIDTCENFESLCASEGPLGELISLTSLVICKCPKFISFPKGGLPTPNLTRLFLRRVNLKSLPECMYALLPSLEELKILECPELESFPEEDFPSKLELVQIDRCEKLIAGSLEWLLQIYPSLSLSISGTYSDMESLPRETLVPSALTSLSFSSCNLLSLNSSRLQHLTSLRKLEIMSCPLLTELPEHMYSLPSLVNLVIGYCGELESFPADGLPSKLESLEISSCSKLIAARMQWDLHRLSSLSHFTISFDENVESFPEENLLPNTLTSLKIEHLKNLKYLDKGIQHLTSLKELKILGCRKVHFLPGEDQPAFLSHIPHVQINGYMR